MQMPDKKETFLAANIFGVMEWFPIHKKSKVYQLLKVYWYFTGS